MTEESKLLKGKDEITQYAGLSWETLQELDGFPARLVGNTWVSHQRAVDGFMTAWLHKKGVDPKIAPYLRKSARSRT